MGVATFEGVVENGQIRLPAAVRLPERTRLCCPLILRSKP